MHNIISKISFFLVFIITGLGAQNRPKVIDLQQVKVGFSISLFNDVDTRDATVAIKMWGDELLGKMGVLYTPETTLYETNDQLIDAINKNEITLISLPIINYFQIKDRVKITPRLVTTINSEPGYDFILIVRKDSDFKQLENLKNSKINVPSNTLGNLVEMWLTTSLNLQGASYNNFFTEINKVEKPIQALYPVFFKQVDACVIPEMAFDTMLELNPQLKNDLIVIDKSPLFINGLMCVNDAMSIELRDSLMSVAKKISNTSSGRQILKLFKSDNIIEFDSKYLSETKKMYEQFVKIKN